MSQISARRIPKFFEMAKAESKNSNFSQHKIGSVLIYKGSKLAVGWNSTKTNPIQKKYNRLRHNFNVDDSCIHNNSIHSEIMTLNKVKYLDIDFEKTALFIYRETKNGKPALAKPCEACTAMIKSLGIKDIYYSTNGGWTHEHWN